MMDLRFFVDNFNVKSYKASEAYLPISSQTAYLRMGQDAVNGDRTPIYVDTVVDERWTKHWWCAKHWWRLGCKHPNHQYVMCLDCDSENGMLAAARILKMNNIGYAVVKSSNGKDHDFSISTGPVYSGFIGGMQGPQGMNGGGPYVTTKYSDHFWIITDYVAPMPHLVNVMRTIPGVDRMYVDYCERKQIMFLRAHVKFTMPTFPDSHTLVTKSAVEWYEAFKTHFESSKMKSVVVARNLRALLHDDAEFNKALHNPDFEV